MNQELMTLDFWQDTVIYEGKTFPVGTLACDALNVPADTITKMNEQCEKINLLLGMLNAGQDTSALFPMAKEAALTMLEILSKTPPFSYMDIPKHRERRCTMKRQGLSSGRSNISSIGRCSLFPQLLR